MNINNKHVAISEQCVKQIIQLVELLNNKQYFKQ